MPRPPWPCSRSSPYRPPRLLHPDSRIRYTTDGSEPGAESALYDAAAGVPLTDGLTVKAIAFADGFEQSGAATAAYTVASPSGTTIHGRVLFGDAPMSSKTGVYPRLEAYR